MPANNIAGYHDLYWLPTGDNGPTDANDWLGGTGPDGMTLEVIHESHQIMGDALGPNTLIDEVYAGGNAFLDFVLQDLKLLVVKRFLNVWAQSSGESINAQDGFVGTPGILGSSVIGVLEAIPRTGTPAASLNSSGGSSRRFYGKIIGPKNFKLDTRPRFVPVRFQCYPFSDSGTNKWFKWITGLGQSL